MQVRGKAMADKAGDLLDLFHDVLLTARLDDKARFRQVRSLSSLKHLLYTLAHAGAKCAVLLITLKTTCVFQQQSFGSITSLVNARSRASIPPFNIANLPPQMVLETKSSLESSIVGSGHSFAATRLDAQRSIAGWIGEQTGGLSYLESIRQLAQRVDSDWDSVQADLSSIRCA